MRFLAQQGALAGSAGMKMFAFVALVACGKGVSSGDASPELVSDQLPSAGSLAVAGGTAYVVSDNRVMKLPVDGGTPEMIGSASAITSVVADEAGAYWLAFDGTQVSLVSEHGVLGGSTSGYSGASINGLAQDAIAVYWADETGAIWRVAKLGGAVQFDMTDTSAGALASDGGTMWVTTLTGAKRLGGGTASFAAKPDLLAWDGASLIGLHVGSGAADGSLMRDGQGVIVDGLTEPVDLAVDDAFYLATANDDSAIRRIALDGSSNDVLVGDANPSYLALDDDYVYWTKRTGELWRVAR